MNPLFYNFRYLLHHKGNNLIKIISLTLGLVVALVLFSKVAFDMSYDNFYPDKERIYRLSVIWNINGKDSYEGNAVNAPFAPTMYQEMPEVESATVMVWGTGETKYLIGERKIVANLTIADSLFFQTFGLPVLAGNTADIGKPYHVFISETLAKRAFGNQDPLGELLLDGRSTSYTVAGIFKDIPQNSHLQMDVILAFNTLYEWGFNPGWQNNDGYIGYVKLAKGIDPKTVEAKIPDMMRRHYDVEEDIRKGTIRTYFLNPITGIHTNDPEVRRSSLILSLLAFSLLFAAAMNYVLISISTLSKRAKSIGVYKCNGASDRNIFQMFTNETLILTIISLASSVLIIFAFRGQIETLMKSELSAIFAPANLWVAGLIVCILFFTTGILPSRVFSSIPVTQVFRTHSDNKKKWKSGLLFVQFVGIAFMMSLLVIIMMQYNMLLNHDVGYQTKDMIISASTRGMTKEQLETAKTEFARLPQVEAVSLSTSLPISMLNGSPVIDPETKETLFTGRYFAADADFINTFNMSLIAGKTFNDNENSNEIIVNEELVQLLGIPNPIGKQIDYARQTWTICGVVKNYQTRSMYEEIFPVIIGASNIFNQGQTLVIRLNSPLTSTLLSDLSGQLRTLSHNEENLFISYKEIYDSYYDDARLFRNSVMTASLIMLIISLLGLFGFIDDEIIRRTKEIAIRKVNGAMAKNILILIAKGITYIAIPAIIIGVMISYLVGSEWLQQFVVKIPLHITLFILCGIAILAIMQFCVIARTYPVANSNPVDHLKSE